MVPVKDGEVSEEIPVVTNAGLGKNSSLGFVIDHPRNRVVVVIADVLGNKFSALAAYDLASWDRIFLTQLSGPGQCLFLLYWNCILLIRFHLIIDHKFPVFQGIEFNDYTFELVMMN